MSDEIERYKARYRREKASRKEAEQLLEDKSRELFELNQNLKELSESLERKVEQRTAALEKAKDEAIRLSQVKSDFLANMSHELRTPMNGVLGMLNLLSERDLSEHSRRLVRTASHSGELLLKIINDILDYTKLEAEKLEIEQVRFQPIELFESTAQPFFAQAYTKKIGFVTFFPPELPDALIGDPTRIQQVLSNIISNAIKFTEHGEVVIKALYKDGNLELSVTDTGVGISEQQIGKIFSAFSQADESTTRKFGGTGLGLSICQHLVQLMGGNIEVQSTINHGSTFTVVLPLEACQLTIPSMKQATSLSNNVLIAAKHPLNREMLSSLITNWRLGSAEMFADGDTLLSRLETDDIDLLLIEDQIFEENPQLKSFLKDFCDFEVIVLALDSEDRLNQNDFTQLSLPYKQSELYNTIAPVFGLNAITVSSKSAFKDIKFKGQHILLVEDNTTNQEVAKEILRLVNLNVTIAENGQEGVDLVATGKFELVLMDIQMPVMDGITATQTIREIGGNYSDIPIIAMTAHSLKGDREKSLDAGMNDHVTKPIDPKVLFTALSRYLDYEEINQKEASLTESDAQQKPKSEEDETPHLEGFDIDTALKRMSGNWTLLKKILSMFKEQQSAFMDDFRELQRKQDQERLVRLVHTLKGSAANVGAEALSAVAKQLEVHLKSHSDNPKTAIDQTINTTKTDLLLQQLSSELNIVINSITLLEEDERN